MTKKRTTKKEMVKTAVKIVQTQFCTWFDCFHMEGFPNAGIPACFELILRHAGIDLGIYAKQFQFTFNMDKINSFENIMLLINGIFPTANIKTVHFSKERYKEKLMFVQVLLEKNKIPLISLGCLHGDPEDKENQILTFHCVPVLDIRQGFLICGQASEHGAQFNFKAKKIIAIPLDKVAEAHCNLAGGRDIAYVE